MDIHSGRLYKIATKLDPDSRAVRVRDYRAGFEEFCSHPEPKSADADGRPCSRLTRGLLQRRPVRIQSLIYIGKESDELEAVENKLIKDWDEVLERYQDPDEKEDWSATVKVMKTIEAKELARIAGVSERAIRKLRHDMPGHRPMCGSSS